MLSAGNIVVLAVAWDGVEPALALVWVAVRRSRGCQLEDVAAFVSRLIATGHDSRHVVPPADTVVSLFALVDQGAGHPPEQGRELVLLPGRERLYRARLELAPDRPN